MVLIKISCGIHAKKLNAPLQGIIVTQQETKMVFPRAFQSYVPRTYCLESHVYGIIVITADRETVVIRGRQSGKWSFPKGHGELTEQPLEAALRELKEETGIVFKKGQLPGDELRFKSGTYFVFYIEEKVELCPQDTTEVIDCMWIPLHRLQYLTGNMDLTTFARRVDSDALYQSLQNRASLCR